MPGRLSPSGGPPMFPGHKTNVAKHRWVRSLTLGTPATCSKGGAVPAPIQPKQKGFPGQSPSLDPGFGPREADRRLPPAPPAGDCSSDSWQGGGNAESLCPPGGCCFWGGHQAGRERRLSSLQDQLAAPQGFSLQTCVYPQSKPRFIMIHLVTTQSYSCSENYSRVVLAFTTVATVTSIQRHRVPGTDDCH